MKQFNAVPFQNVNITGGFWAHRQQINRDITTKAVMNRFQETGRFDAFRLDWKEGMPNKPHYFWDSDVAKWIEGVAYLMEKGNVPEYEPLVEWLIDCIERGQGEDGYFNIYFTVIQPEARFTNRTWHELYCAGHLIEAAIAYHQASGRDKFLKLMMKYADYIDRVFRVEQSASFLTPGHQEIELALVKLYRHTGLEKYLTLAKFFIDQRGANELDTISDEWKTTCHTNQSHVPVREMSTAEGHAVRAGYLYSAMADIARECGDESLFAACRRIFDNIIHERMYITGGVGSTRTHEAFTVDYDLPNRFAYTETCAAISMVYFAQRMLTLEADARYADVIETILYNGFLSGVSLSGDRFFYTNPLAISLRDHGRNVSYPIGGEWLPITQRVAVFGCSCCPPNVTRFVASVGDYLYTTHKNRLYVHQFMESNSIITLNGQSICIHQETNYPTEGTIRLTIKGGKGVQIAVRIPAWCNEYSLNTSYILENGYAVANVTDDCFEICLNMNIQPELIESNPEVQANVGRVALRRGPIVYCIEGIDNGERIQDIRLDVDMEAQVSYCDSMKMPIITVKGWRRPAARGRWLYRPLNEALEEIRVKFIPYYAFANRGESDMQVWTLVR